MFAVFFRRTSVSLARRCISSRFMSTLNPESEKWKMTGVESEKSVKKFGPIPSPSVLMEERMPDGKEKKMGRVLEDMLEILYGRDTNETLDFVSKYWSMMNTHHVYRSFANIMREVKSLDLNTDVIQALRSDENFQKLCVLAGKKATHFDAKHCSYMIRYLIHLGFNSDSTLLQLFLELFKHHVNDLKLADIAVSGHYLKLLDRTEQTEFLLKIFAMAVDNNLKHDLNLLESDKLTYILESYGHFLQNQNLELLLEELRIRRNSRLFNKPELVLKSLAELDIKDSDVIQGCVEVASEFLDEDRFEIDQVTDVLAALKHFGWHAPNLFTKVVKFIRDSELNDWQCLARVCSDLMSCSYYPRSLMEDLFGKIESLNLSDMPVDDYELLREIFRDSEYILESNYHVIKTKLNLENFPDLDNASLDRAFEKDLDVISRNLELCNIGSICRNATERQVIDIEYSENSKISVVVLKNDDYFQNVAKVKGSRFKIVTNLMSEGRRVCVLSLLRVKKLPEKEKTETLKVKLREAHDEGISYFL